MTSFGFKTEEDSLSKLLLNFLKENEQVQKILGKYNSSVQKLLVKCLPDSKSVSLLNNQFFITNLKHILQLTNFTPISITPAFFSLFAHQYSMHMLITIGSHLRRVIHTFKNNILVNINLFRCENLFLVLITTVVPSILGWVLNLKGIKNVKWVQALRNWNFIKVSGIINLSAMILMILFIFSVHAFITPCYDYFLPLHEHVIEIVINNSYKTKTLGYAMPNSFKHKDQGVVLLYC